MIHDKRREATPRQLDQVACRAALSVVRAVTGIIAEGRWVPNDAASAIVALSAQRNLAIMTNVLPSGDMVMTNRRGRPSSMTGSADLTARMAHDAYVMIGAIRAARSLGRAVLCEMTDAVLLDPRVEADLIPAFSLLVITGDPA